MACVSSSEPVETEVASDITQRVWRCETCERTDRVDDRAAVQRMAVEHLRPIARRLLLLLIAVFVVGGAIFGAIAGWLAWSLTHSQATAWTSGLILASGYIIYKAIRAHLRVKQLANETLRPGGPMFDSTPTG